MPPPLSVVNTKPGDALVRRQGWTPWQEEGGSWRRVIAGERPAWMGRSGVPAPPDSPANAPDAPESPPGPGEPLEPGFPQEPRERDEPGDGDE